MSSPKQQFYKLGLIGHPVAHSLSPLMHRAAIAFSGLAGSYDLIDLPGDRLRAGIMRLKDDGYAGLNVTVPHKQAVMNLVDDLTSEARLVQAVNTIAINNGRLLGHNTDLQGFLRALSQVIPLPGHNNQEQDFVAGASQTGACLIGSGGAARAALTGLCQAGFNRILIVARNGHAAHSMCEQFRISGLPSIGERKSQNEPLFEVLDLDLPDEQELPRLMVVVNTTSIGVTNTQVPSWYQQLLSRCAQQAAPPHFFDMVYANGTEPTVLVALARSYNLPASDGLQMLIEQASLAFQFWTGIEVPGAVMRSGLEAGY